MSHTNQVIYTDTDVRGWLHSIMRQMMHDNWRPDYIVGLTRGGLIPATMLSHYMNIPMHTLNVSFRDESIGPESNLWMAEDAFGYVAKESRNESGAVSDAAYRRNILIVDDINDSGRTLQWIRDDWTSGCLPNDPSWQEVWGGNVRTAVLINNEASEVKDINYAGIEINKLEQPKWCVFPWERWWE